VPPRTRKPWDQLSADYRKRLLGAGRTGSLTGTAGLSEAEVRRYYESGGDLRKARGHGFQEPSSAAPEQARTRLIAGTDTAKDRAQLRRWRERQAPSWIPKDQADISDRVAAILSTIAPPPSKWKQVKVSFLSNGKATLEIQPKGNGYPFQLELPDHEAARQVLGLISTMKYPGLSVSVSTVGYGAPGKEAPEEPEPPKRPRGGAKADEEPGPRAEESRGAKKSAQRKAPAKKAPGKKKPAASTTKKPAKKRTTAKATPVKKRARARNQPPSILAEAIDLLGAEQVEQLLRRAIEQAGEAL
jgi:hypothetical protein